MGWFRKSLGPRASCRRAGVGKWGSRQAECFGGCERIATAGVGAESVRVMRICVGRSGREERDVVAARRPHNADDNRAYRKTINLPCHCSYTSWLRGGSWWYTASSWCCPASSWDEGYGQVMSQASERVACARAEWRDGIECTKECCARTVTVSFWYVPIPGRGKVSSTTEMIGTFSSGPGPSRGLEWVGVVPELRLTVSKP